MNINKKKRVVSIMLCVAMLAPMASMAMPVGAQGEDAFTSSSVDTQKDIGEPGLAVTDCFKDDNDPGNRWYYAKTAEDVEYKGECSICEVVTGEWVDSNGNKYYFVREDGNEESQMAVGFVEIDGEEYYFYEDGYRKGQMAVGFAKIDGEEYYFYEDENRKGQMVVGWAEIDGEEYYFYEDGYRKGQMVVGWCETEDGSRYYFYEDENRKGQMVVGWAEIDGAEYYFYEDGYRKGQMAKREIVEINGQTYYFGEDGICEKI